MSRHNPVRVQTYEFEYLRQEAGIRVHVELNMWVTLQKRNVWSEAGQLLYRRMEEPSTPELSDRQHLIIQRMHCTVSPLCAYLAFANSCRTSALAVCRSALHLQFFWTTIFTAKNVWCIN